MKKSSDALKGSQDKKALTKEEREELKDCEKSIETHVRSFIEAGNALATIRDQNLHRETHRTFEKYCADRWDLSRSRAYQLIDAAEAVENLSTIVDINDIASPENECQVRPLVGLKKEVAEEAWTLAAETAKNGRMTGETVKQAVSKTLNEKPSVNELDRFLSSFQRGSDAIAKAAEEFPPREWDLNTRKRFENSLKPILRIAVDASILDLAAVGDCESESKQS